MPYKNKEQQREYQRVWTANRRAAFFADKACVDCGSTENLELDHIDPEQKVSHSIWSWSLERREAEIEKCQILCRSCHIIKSSVEVSGHPPYQHGTITEYQRQCRCDECRAWKSEYRHDLQLRGGIWK